MAITLDVITKVVEGSLRDSSTTVEKHFNRAGSEAGTGFSKSFSKSISNSADMQKAFDKAADAAGKLRVEQQKLNELQEKGAGGAKLIAQQERLAKVTRETERAVRDTAATFQQADRAAGSMLSTLSNITAGTRFGGITSQASTLASSLSGVGAAAAIAIGGVTAVAVGAVAAATKLYDMGRMWDDISDNITAKTGKFGDELKSITDQVAAVSTTTAATQEELGGIAAQAVQSLRLSGDQLGGMIKQIAELNKLTGDQTNMRGLGMVFRMFKVDAQEQIPFLNELYSTFQKTGIPVNDLIATLDKGGTVLSGFGMSATQAAATIALFEDAGVPADQAMRGLTTAFKQLNAAGKDPVQGLRDMVTQIKALHDAGNDLGAGGARDMAEQYFGKGFGPILQSIIDSRFEIDKLPTSLEGVSNSIQGATDKTADFSEHWQMFKNQLSADLKPASESFFSFLNSQLDQALDTTNKFFQAWKEGSSGEWFGPNTGFGKALAAIKGLLTGDFPTLPNTTWNGSDAELLGKAQPGRYLKANEDQGQADITQGLGDCTSAIEDLIAIMDGQPTEGRSMATSNADQWLVEHGFMPTNEMVPGAFNVGFNDHHMQATLPGGTNFNWGSDEAAAQRGINGGGAFDPTQGFTKHYYRPTEVKPTTPMPGADQFPTGASQRQHRGLPAAGAPGSLPGGQSLTDPRLTAPVGPGTVSPSVADFPSPDAVGPAAANMTPVQMVPSPFGPQYGPVPAGSTPGYNQNGAAGTYLSDPERVKSATKHYQDSLDNINQANDAIAEAKARQIEIENDVTADSKKRADAAKDVANAEKRRNQLIEDAEEAKDQLAQAKLGTFREAQKAQKAKAGKNGSDIGSPLADDFGLSEGLPGLAKWLTTFAMNMAMAPMIGSMQAVSNASPYQGGHGMLGIMGANNMANGLTPLGLSSGASFMPGAAAYTPGASAIGPAPLGGGMVPGLVPPVGPGTAPPAAGAGAPAGPSVSSNAPGAGPGGGGFSGLGGSMMGSISGAVSMAAPALDAMAPGAGQAAQIGVQLANRTIGYAGQAAGIGVGGLLETFLPHGSALADPNKSWVGRIASGVAGARPALPNAAGGENPAGSSAPPQTPEQAQALQAQNGGGQSGGPMVHVENMNNYSNDGGQSISNQIARSQMSSYMSGGPR